MFGKRVIVWALGAMMAFSVLGCESKEADNASNDTAAPLAIPDDAATKTLTITGMHCGSCAQSTQASLGNIEGVYAATVSFEAKQAVVQCDKQVTDEQLIAAVTAVGYTAKAE